MERQELWHRTKQGLQGGGEFGNSGAQSRHQGCENGRPTAQDKKVLITES